MCILQLHMQIVLKAAVLTALYMFEIYRHILVYFSNIVGHQVPTKKINAYVSNSWPVRLTAACMQVIKKTSSFHSSQKILEKRTCVEDILNVQSETHIVLCHLKRSEINKL